MRKFIVLSIRKYSYLLSSALFLFVFWAVFHYFEHLAWGQAFGRFLGLVLLGGATKIASRPLVESRKLSKREARIECLLWAAVATAAAVFGIVEYHEHFFDYPRVDRGRYVITAVKALYLQGINPYETTSIRPMGIVGFKHGPFYFLAYVPVLLFASLGFKIMNIIYFLLAIVTLWLLLAEKRDSKVHNSATALFCITCFLISQRVWKDIFFDGGIDIVPVLLILICFLCIKKESWLLVGITVGLCLSAKFAPGVLVVLLLRRKTNTRLIKGLLIGVFPMVVFYLWNPISIFSNQFLYNFTKGFDITSLYSITPRIMHFVFPLLQIGALVYFWCKNFWQPVKLHLLIMDYFMLLLILDLCYREVHRNHLMWFIPTAAVIFSWNRHRVSILQSN